MYRLNELFCQHLILETFVLISIKVIFIDSYRDSGDALSIIVAIEWLKHEFRIVLRKSNIVLFIIIYIYYTR